MPRFFVPSDNFFDGGVKICGDDAFHIARSLRMAEGDALTVCDMHGVEHACILTRIRDDEVLCEIKSSKKGENESPVKVTLYMAYPKGDKLETVVQKATELGAVRIVPFESSRCIKRPSKEKAEKNTARLSRIAEEAAKQCGRAAIPKVAPPMTFDEMLSDAQKCSLVLFCYEGDGTRTAKEILDGVPSADSIGIIVGSEGGFSISEAERARTLGFSMTGLGKRILRCETAPIYALCAVSYRFEL